MEEDHSVKNNKNCQEIRRPSKLLLTVKIIFFVICLTGFSYQASEFLGFYFQYPSVIELRTETLNIIAAPALTYCHVNKLAKNNFCKMFPHACHNLTKGDEDCEHFPLYCDENIQVPFWCKCSNLSDIYLENFTASEVNITDFLANTSWPVPKEERAGPFFYGTWWSLNILTCYTLHSRVNSNKDPFEVKFKMPGVIAPSLKNYVGNMTFNLQDAAVFNPNTSLGVAIAVHSPFTNTFPDMKNLLELGNRYEIEMSIKEEHLLSSPYKTNCMNYTLLWEKNNRSGPRSKKMCEDLCGVQYNVACRGCVDAWNLYPHSEKRCIQLFKRFGDDKCTASLSKKYDDCKLQCKRECSITKYSYSVSKMKKDPWDSRGYSRGKVEVDIFLDPDILILTHSPKYQNVELFSNIGGYIGIWLGISLFAVTDLIKNIIITIRPCLHRYRLKFRRSSQG